MDSTILLSIIIPVYNGENYISRCLTSIYSQKIDLKEYEVVIINDGSTDNTISIIQDFENRFENLRLINQKNEGVSAARNKGIDLSNGFFIAFLDSDDELMNSSLERVLQVVRNSDVELLITDMWNCCGNKMTKRRSPVLEVGKEYSGIEAFNIGYQRTNAGGAICKKSFIQEKKLRFPVGVSNGEDTIFFSEYQSFCKKIQYEKIDFYKINLVSNSASRGVDINTINGFQRAVSVMNSFRNTMGKEVDNRIIEYTIYLLLSNLIHVVSKVDGFGSNYIKTIVKNNDILPIDNTHFVSEKLKSTIINKCWFIYYVLIIIKDKLSMK